jgi:cytidylate kinase
MPCFIFINYLCFHNSYKQMKKITIAIDGFSSCGKSTMAKNLAKETGYLYIDSGAMYRAVTLYSMENGIIRENEIDEEKLRQNLNDIQITFLLDAATHQPLTFLKGVNVEEKIRTIEVSSKVSPISTLEFVRKAMVAQQRKLGEEKGIIMDGRDIGTTVFPHAELKIFVTASPEIRAQRRYDELIAKGVKIEWEDILKNVKERDYIDQNRQISPLRKAADAILLDNSQMTLAEQRAWLWEQYCKAIQ